MVICSTIGILISSIQYDISYFAEQIAAISAISAAAYTLDALINKGSRQRLIIGGAFCISTWSYFIPIFTSWSVSIMTDLAIILFCIIGVFYNGTMRKG